jgi:hypothetical protein
LAALGYGTRVSFVHPETWQRWYIFRRNNSRSALKIDLNVNPEMPES